MQQEIPAEHKQTISVVDGNPFITTELIRTDITGKKFVTFKNTVPYEGGLEKLKAEAEALKAQEIERHTAVIADADAKLAEVDKALAPVVEPDKK